MRETVCLRRVDGRWVITHEHISIPMKPQDPSSLVRAEQRRARRCGQDDLRSRGAGAACAVRCAQDSRQVGVIETTTSTCSGFG
ncbi:hypothetical protein ACFVH4_08345 [Nocardia ignorata]|uniref:hypothetical protein n=1 Tax=Nocardia ignorata TaxID=145285 RepID=UPI00362FE3A5